MGLLSELGQAKGQVCLFCGEFGRAFLPVCNYRGGSESEGLSSVSFCGSKSVEMDPEPARAPCSTVRQRTWLPGWAGRRFGDPGGLESTYLLRSEP